MTMEFYKRPGEPHVKALKQITSEEVKEIQKEMKAQLHAINNIFKTGEDTNTERMWSVKKLRSAVIHMIKFLAKDHKQVGEDGLPPGTLCVKPAQQ